ncbi:MAG: GNAT family N-acetyltransferase [Spirochaetales bacterium]|nr:GNAT family N-acetyltransferase [Spirochaetales bacterium]
MILENFTQDDISEFLSWVQGCTPEFLCQFAGPRYHHPLDQTQLQATLEDDSVVMLKLMDSGQMLAHAQIMRISSSQNTASLGRILVHPQFQGQGHSTRLMHLLKEYLLHHYEITNITLQVYDFNHNAIKSYRKNGFVEIRRTHQPIPQLNSTWISIEMQYSGE